MSGYIPGSGRKRPMNNLETPIYPDIKKGPPRFLWSRKKWTVDTGRTMNEVEHIPQLQENAVLYQSYNYGSQHAYGKHPTYDAFVNEEFRPPLIERDDILPLSRLPRPVITDARINPGTAYPGGGGVFVDHQNSVPGIEKYLTNRVKKGEVRPTFFSPIDVPEDNSVLPDLEIKLPATSVSARYNFSIGNSIDNRDYDLDYKRPQVSVTSGEIIPVESFTVSDYDLDYSRPQISASSGIGSVIDNGVTPIEIELQNKSSPVSATAGINSNIKDSFSPVDYDFRSKIEGNQAVPVFTKGVEVYNRTSDESNIRGNVSKLGKRMDSYTYKVPSNTIFKKQEVDHPKFRRKVQSLEKYTPRITQSYIPRAGITDPNYKLKK